MNIRDGKLVLTAICLMVAVRYLESGEFGWAAFGFLLSSILAESIS